MNAKFLIGLVPLLLLSATAWRFSQSLPVEQGAQSNAGAKAPPATVLDETIMQAYAPFDSEQTFVLPAGPKGLEYSAETRRLEGKKVRIAGSMVRHLHDDAAVFLMTPQPMVLNMEEYGLADSLPPHAVHVVLPVLPGQAPSWVRPPLVVYGRLELGCRTELDSRISHIRVIADHVTAADGRTLIEPRRSVMLQPARINAGKVKLQTLSAPNSK